MKTKSNQASDGLTLLALASQIGCARETARKKLHAANIEVRPGKRYSLREIQSAFQSEFGGPRRSNAPDGFRQLAINAALVQFQNEWGDAEPLRGLLKRKCGLTDAQFERIALCCFGINATLTAFFVMRQIDILADFKETARHFGYSSQPPKMVEINIPQWIRAAAKKHPDMKFQCLEAETATFDQSLGDNNSGGATEQETEE